MKDNTYVIPAIKFYILKEPENLSSTLNEEAVAFEFNKMINETRLTLIPFSDVDGLTVSELALSLHIKKYFAIAAVNVYDGQFIIQKGSVPSKGFSFFDSVIFSLSDDKMNVEVDKMFETYIEGVYSNATDRQKRIYNSFLEQYRYQDYEKATQKIKEIKENRK